MWSSSSVCRVIQTIQRLRHASLCRDILIHPPCAAICVCSCRRAVHASARGWCWLRGCCSSEGREMHRMFTPWFQHSHTHIWTHTEIGSDEASSGIWHTEKNCMLGPSEARWEAGSNNGLYLSDVKWLLTEGLLMVVCGTKETFREPSKLLLNAASDYYSGRCSVFVSVELHLIIRLIGI